VGEIGHPTVVLIGDVEGDFGGGAGSMDEERYAILRWASAKEGGGFNDFADVDFGGLAGDGGDGGMDRDVMVNAEKAVRIVSVCGNGDCEEGEDTGELGNGTGESHAGFFLPRKFTWTEDAGDGRDGDLWHGMKLQDGKGRNREVKMCRNRKVGRRLAEWARHVIESKSKRGRAWRRALRRSAENWR
jgi:hypothetical protein